MTSVPRPLAIRTIGGELAADPRRSSDAVTGRMTVGLCRQASQPGNRFVVSVDGKYWGDGVTERVVWHVVKDYAKRLGFATLAPHDLRRSCAKLCHAGGGELEQIQFLLGHVSVQTTERYLGCKQRISGAVNDRIGIEPQSPLRDSSEMPTIRPSDRRRAPLRLGRTNGARW